MDYIKTWKEVILRPSDFYRRMPTTGGYADPLTFALISSIINTLLFALVRPTMLTLVGMHVPRINLSIFSTVIILFIANIVSLFILALIFNLLYKALGGAGSYEGTVRFISYSSAPTVLSWIPILGLITGIYELYLCTVGGMIVHNVSMKKSTILVLPFALLVMFFGVRAILSGFAH
jgi:hypothetical protein